ncbi:hypothetical protein BGZ63DRAFT_391573 [Mariannaea sp. PMI_226]|nr:hypothetical protein BGZ63DRAFT_391573 [Mariannaea sp. PMI_226]
MVRIHAFQAWGQGSIPWMSISFWVWVFSFLVTQCRRAGRQHLSTWATVRSHMHRFLSQKQLFSFNSLVTVQDDGVWNFLPYVSSIRIGSIDV